MSAPSADPAERGPERARDRLAAVRAAVAAAGGERPARAGDLFALPETASWPVEWLVVDTAAGEPEPLVAVPADGHPLAGSGDVAVSDDAPVGPLTVRCRFAVRLGERNLTPALRTGLVGPEILAEVRRRCAEVEAGGPAASVEQEEIDSSPEYRLWIRDMVAPARDTLAAVHAQAASRRAEPRRPPARRIPLLGRALPLAASVLLAISLTLGGGVVVQSRRLERLEAGGADTERRLRAQVETMTAARRAQAEAHRLEVERLTRERLATLDEAARQAPPPVAPRPLVNLPFAWLRPERDPTRGEPQAIAVPATAGLVALILPIDDPGPFEHFRLEVVREASGRRVWSTDELVLTGLAETSLALPGELLVAGDYVLHLSGHAGGQIEPLATYRLRVDGAAASSP